ncbi:hypothetical protein CVT25_014421 [Psilocybe cyanescens]|uniref:Uncharacterized protein n=1 Tax=Psilocybe cyanescens TaxID=93625 RepID=A0A409VZ28_PSICY|nr:hypothetical protein CVT25_014421 [Psilocybe cyanescens]
MNLILSLIAITIDHPPPTEPNSPPHTSRLHVRPRLSALLIELLFGLEAATVHTLRFEVNALTRKASSAFASAPPPPFLLQFLWLLKFNITNSNPPAQSQPTPTSITPHPLSSLFSLPAFKPRLLTVALSPHKILHHITHFGVDLSDRAADVGVASDFVFPVRDYVGGSGVVRDLGLKECEGEGEGERKLEIGHNLYAREYVLEFSPFADAFRAGKMKDEEGKDKEHRRPICPCAACLPIACAPSERLHHGVDGPAHAFSGEREPSSESDKKIPETKAKETQVLVAEKSNHHIM